VGGDGEKQERGSKKKYRDCRGCDDELWTRTVKDTESPQGGGGGIAEWKKRAALRETGSYLVERGFKL